MTKKRDTAEDSGNGEEGGDGVRLDLERRR